MAISNSLLTTTVAAIYTSVNESTIATMYFCNYSGASATFSVYAVPSGNTASNSNIIYQTVSVTAGDTYVVDLEKLILDNGDTIQANASANTSFTATVSTFGL